MFIFLPNFQDPTFIKGYKIYALRLFRCLDKTDMEENTVQSWFSYIKFSDNLRFSGYFAKKTWKDYFKKSFKTLLHSFVKKD